MIGIIGYGVVGKACHNMLDGHRVLIYDPLKGYVDFLMDTEAVFVCVPIPANDNGQNLCNLTDTLDRLKGYKGLIIIKSTILPGNIKYIIRTYPELSIMHAPEFLNQFEPFYAHERHLIGVQNIEQARIYREIFRLGGYGDRDVRTTDPVTAAMAKYMHNLHGVLKVTFCHEIFEVCEREGINYREVLGAVLSSNDNMGEKYTRIAADGKMGYGGFCFPENAKSFVNMYEIKTIKSCIEKNKEWRIIK